MMRDKETGNTGDRACGKAVLGCILCFCDGVGGHGESG